MAKFFVKPVVWNTEKYRHPSGAEFSSGFPKDNGFGHEEWNNSDLFEYSTNSARWRVFHTEGFGNQPLDEYRGNITIFMIASHGGEQLLVGIAARASSLIGDQHRAERERLVKRLKLDGDRWRDAWQLASVKTCYQNERSRFLQEWKKDLHLTPTWKCPADHFTWFDTPIKLDAKKITGKKRLIGMYGSYQELSHDEAEAMFRQIPASKRSPSIKRIQKAPTKQKKDLAADIDEINSQKTLTETTRKALVNARIGQGKFKTDLMKIWGGTCAVSGCTLREALRASHIRPWSVSSNRQRLDPNNGLLLAATLDALFDEGLISFQDDGEMLVSNRVEASERKRLHLPSPLKRALNDAQRHYLSYHRTAVWEEI